MASFYLHVCTSTDFIEDEEGHELPNELAARQVALAGARGMMAADLQRGEIDLGSEIKVEDQNHRPLFTITFADAVTLKNDQPVVVRSQIGH